MSKTLRLFYKIFFCLQNISTLKKSASSLRGKEYFAKEPEPGVFWHLGAGATRKKIPGAGAGAGAAWKKVRSRSQSPLKKSQSEPEALKNLLAPQPWFSLFIRHFGSTGKGAHQKNLKKKSLKWMILKKKKLWF